MFQAVQSQAEQSLKRAVALSLLPFFFFLSVSRSLFPVSPLLAGARSFLLSSCSNGLINGALWERSCSASYRSLLPNADSLSVLGVNGGEHSLCHQATGDSSYYEVGFLTFFPGLRRVGQDTFSY